MHCKNSMKAVAYALLAGLIGFGGNSGIGYAQEDHEKLAEQHLKKAIESGRKGNAKEVAHHTEEARKQLIEQNKEHPYAHPIVPIYGEKQKAEHDEATFEEMAKAISAAKQGNAEEAGEAARRAYIHLKQKEQSR
ncbi:Small metal-binding protein [Nitrosospira sp. Nl5]|nr:Small metal-binding protein [Nitrosospira sp. Nl5]